MKLSEQKKTEWERTLRDAALIGPIDTIQEHTNGDLWDFTSQIRGNYFFSTEKFVFVSGGLIGKVTFSIPYNKITELKLCNIGGLIPLIPTGIRVTYTDENGKSVKKKCSVMKRKQWLAYLKEKTGISSN
ncbi:MAG: hypothetical protein K2M91_10660 [Lachnospiraceae bacterium]|nr:hypothetical protein [Lachnospiraceae bacterium]